MSRNLIHKVIFEYAPNRGKFPDSPEDFQMSLYRQEDLEKPLVEILAGHPITLPKTGANFGLEIKPILEKKVAGVNSQFNFGGLEQVKLTMRFWELLKTTRSGIRFDFEKGRTPFCLATLLIFPVETAYDKYELQELEEHLQHLPLPTRDPESEAPFDPFEL
jgi:hypothetical protein